MIYRNLRFALNSAWQSFWRNLAVSMAAVVSITLILILAGVNLLVGHAFSQVLDNFRAKLSYDDGVLRLDDLSAQVPGDKGGAGAELRRRIVQEA